MPIIETGAAAIAGLKDMVTLIGEIKDSYDLDKVKERAAGMIERILAAHAEVARLAKVADEAEQRARGAEAELQRVMDFDNTSPEFEKRGYWPGVYIYERKGNQPGTATEKFCPHCFGKRKLSSLAPTTFVDQRCRTYVCPECKNKFELGSALATG